MIGESLLAVGLRLNCCVCKGVACCVEVTCCKYCCSSAANWVCKVGGTTMAPGAVVGIRSW